MLLFDELVCVFFYVCIVCESVFISLKDVAMSVFVRSFICLRAVFFYLLMVCFNSVFFVY